MIGSGLIVFTLVTIHLVHSFPFTDECLRIDGKEDFDIKKFGAKWYEIVRVNNSAPVSTKCHEEQYISGKKYVIIHADFYNPSRNSQSFIEGVGEVNAASPSKIAFNFPTADAAGVITVVDTDYNTYAALYTCNTYEYLTISHFWIVSRTRELSSENVSNLLAKYQAAGGDTSRLIYIDQTDCPERNE